MASSIGTQADFSMHSGDTRRLEITIVDENSAAVNLSTATITWALSKKDSASVAPKGSALLTKTLANGGITIVSAAAGRCDVDLASSDTVTFSGDYYHELELTILATVSTVLYGAVTIIKDLI